MNDAIIEQETARKMMGELHHKHAKQRRKTVQKKRKEKLQHN